jgi:threonyl-tRNA synthetase
VSSTELSALENICKTIIKEKQPFERLEVSKETLLEMFKVPGETSIKAFS